MSAVESQMLELGIAAVDFSLPDVNGNLHSLRTDASAHLVMFICNHCPFVKHIRAELAQLGHDYLPRDVAIYAINSNDAETHPGDSAEKMCEESKNWGYEFPYLIDANQEVAKSYMAACTPDFFLFDADNGLVYRGQLDGSRPSNNIPVNGKDLRAAIDATLNNSDVPGEQIPSIGCSIKWKSGNKPAYFS